MKTRGFLKVMSTFLLALSMLTGMVFVADAANGDLTVTVEAQVPAVAYGKTVEVQVRIDENPGFLGVNFDVKWDGAVLEFVSADKTGADFDKVEANSRRSLTKWYSQWAIRCLASCIRITPSSIRTPAR